MTQLNFRKHTGTLAGLQVDENHQRKGLGALIVRAMAKQLAESGEDTITSVIHENEASQATFRKLGFQYIGRSFWAGIEPSPLE